MIDVRKNNVGLYQTRSSDGAADIQTHLILAIRFIQNKDVGAELYCNYCNSCKFNS